MTPRKASTMLLVADLAAAEAWHTKLPGRGPDSRPLDTLMQREISEPDGIVGDYSTLAQVRDSDGNLVTLTTPPSRPYPPA